MSEATESGSWSSRPASIRGPGSTAGDPQRSASGKRAARALLVALEADVQNGLVTAADPTFGDLLDSWMEHIGGRGRSDATLYNYQRYIDREIKPVFGPTRLSKLTVLDLDRFYGRLSKRGLAPAIGATDSRCHPRR